MANIEHLQTVNAPASTVYEALTTAKGLSEIWTSELIVSDQIGYINEFRFGGKGLTKMRVDELITDKKILWQCVDSNPEWIGTTISFDMEEKNGKTSIIFRQMNWQKVTAFYRLCNYNWAIFFVQS
ncbi:SRPBCC domain-containing protein [Paenibacillus sp. NPDC058174]|uniref:SRPBCC family protein n=1 Tax=Paenibacillus sp. NPDC058174 TaxID=3346366 RepID=UPI0036D80718